jgi:nicotinamide mononucleotide (NMN) deamidase PncC
VQQLQQQRDSHAEAVQALQQQLERTHALARQQAEAMAAGDASQMDTHVSAAASVI